MQDSYWQKTIDRWLHDLQRYYFLQFKQLSHFIKVKDRIPSYHTPDDGKSRVLIIDLIQNMFECCGRTTGYKDWNSPHVYRPKNHTFRKAMGIPILEERAHYLVPTLTNSSVPFSCCRWKHTSSALAPVPCDHMLVQDPNTLFDRGCVEPLSRFIQQYWMGLHLVPLLMVILTMIPQMFLLLTTIQPKQLRIQSIEACIDFSNHMENRMKQFQNGRQRHVQHVIQE
ncbi:hypothetical protein AHF37_02319 [Paragonimus kellicotti]|nr:hypothetical protein AHF37_02319 [Paragonimus kellicotti]